MQRKGSPFNSAAAHKISLRVIQHFIAVYVAVVVWSGNRERMIIEKPRNKRTDHEIPSLKCLMHGRRLVDTSGDRFEIVDGESIRPEKTVPTSEIQGTVIINVLM